MPRLDDNPDGAMPLATTTGTIALRLNSTSQCDGYIRNLPAASHTVNLVAERPGYISDSTSNQSSHIA